MSVEESLDPAEAWIEGSDDVCAERVKTRKNHATRHCSFFNPKHQPSNQRMANAATEPRCQRRDNVAQAMFGEMSEEVQQGPSSHS